MQYRSVTSNENLAQYPTANPMSCLHTIGAFLTVKALCCVLQVSFQPITASPSRLDQPSVLMHVLPVFLFSQSVGRIQKSGVCLIQLQFSVSMLLLLSIHCKFVHEFRVRV